MTCGNGEEKLLYCDTDRFCAPAMAVDQAPASAQVCGARSVCTGRTATQPLPPEPAEQARGACGRRPPGQKASRPGSARLGKQTARAASVTRLFLFPKTFLGP